MGSSVMGILYDYTEGNVTFNCPHCSEEQLIPETEPFLWEDGTVKVKCDSCDNTVFFKTELLPGWTISTEEE